MNCKKTTLNLGELLKVTDAFLVFADALDRKLMKSERDTYRWILTAWETRKVTSECAMVADYRIAAMTKRIEQLREIICPDPVRRRKFNRANVKKLLQNGEPIEKADPMTDYEASQRLLLLRKLMSSTIHVLKELSLHEGANRGLLMGKKLRHFLKLSRHLANEIENSAQGLQPARQIIMETVNAL